MKSTPWRSKRQARGPRKMALLLVMGLGLSLIAGSCSMGRSEVPNADGLRKRWMSRVLGLEQHVGAGDELREHLASLGLLEIQRHAALAVFAATVGIADFLAQTVVGGRIAVGRIAAAFRLGLFAPIPILAKSAFLLIMLLLAGMGLREFYDLSERGGFPARPWQGTLAGMAMVAGVFLLLALPPLRRERSVRRWHNRPSHRTC